MVMWLFLLNSCDEKLNPYHYGPYLEEGEKLEAEHISTNQPTSRAEYSKFIAISLYSGVGVVRINEDKRPELVKTIDTRMRMSHIKFDKDGLLWIAAPFGINDYIGERQIYIIDPHTEKVHKRINLPKELMRPSFFVFFDDKVYVRGDREGCSVGIGMIDRNDYNSKLLLELENTGYEITTGMFAHNGYIILNTGWTCTDPDSTKLLKFDPVENEIIISSKFANSCTYDNNYIYTAGSYYGIDEPRLYKLDYDLNVVDYVKLDDYNLSITHNNKFVYIMDDYYLDIYDKGSLTKVRRLTVPFDLLDPILNYNTGFITNNVLSINLNHIYVISEDKFYPNYFDLGDDGGGQNPPQLPEGYTLADYD